MVGVSGYGCLWHDESSLGLLVAYLFICWVELLTDSRSILLTTLIMCVHFMSKICLIMTVIDDNLYGFF